jgi:two-component system, response regulator PdtaR
MQSNKQAADLGEQVPTVLVVEDEVLVRTAAAKYLRDNGFKVLEAVTADEAVEMLRAVPEVHAVFSDVKLPGHHSGVDLAEIILRDYRHIKILLTSAVAPFPEVQGITLLRKPYFLFEVERRLRSILGMPFPDESPSNGP